MAGITLRQTVRASERAVTANFKRRHDPYIGDLYREGTRTAIRELRKLRAVLKIHGVTA